MQETVCTPCGLSAPTCWSRAWLCWTARAPAPTTPPAWCPPTLCSWSAWSWRSEWWAARRRGSSSTEKARRYNCCTHCWLTLNKPWVKKFETIADQAFLFYQQQTYLKVKIELMIHHWNKIKLRMLNLNDDLIYENKIKLKDESFISSLYCVFNFVILFDSKFSVVDQLTWMYWELQHSSPEKKNYYLGELVNSFETKKVCRKCLCKFNPIFPGIVPIGTLKNTLSLIGQWKI